MTLVLGLSRLIIPFVIIARSGSHLMTIYSLIALEDASGDTDPSEARL